MFSPADPTEDDPEASEPSALHAAAGRFAALADDLPFVPLRPYEPRWLQLSWRGGLIALMAAGVLLPSVVGGWMWQDERLILSDVALRTVRGLGAIWAGPLTGAPPGVRTLWWLELHAFGPQPIAFRVVGLVLHLMTTGTLWLAMRRVGVTGAWLIAAAFALHPLTLPNVAWPARQGEVLGLFAAATAFLAFLRARRVQPDADDREWTDPAFQVDPEEERPPRWPWAVFGAAAILGLTTGSAAGAVAAAGAAVIERRRAAGRSRIVYVTLAVWATAAVAARLVLPVTTAVPNPAASGPAWAEAAVALPWTLWHAVLPLGLPLVYDRTQWASPAWTVTLAVVTLVVIGLPWLRRTAWTLTLAAAGVLAVLHGLAMTRHKAEAVVVADLLPYGVVFAVLAGGAGLAFRRLRRHAGERTARAVRWLVGVGTVGVLGTLTTLRAFDFAGVDEAWHASLARDPDGLVARTELAANYLAEDFLEEAGLQLDRVPDGRRDVGWLLARGRIYDKQKQYAAAAATYEAACRLRPDDPATTIPLAEAQVNIGRPDRAAELYEGLIRTRPADPGVYTNAGLAQMRIGKARQAADYYEKALALDPRYLPAHIDLANALFELGQYEASSKHLQEAVRLDPRNFAAFMNAGVLLYRLRDPAKAERMFRAAVTINPRSADAFSDLGVALAAQEKRSEAQWSFAQALRIDPDHEARAHLTRLKQSPGPATQRARP